MYRYYHEDAFNLLYRISVDKGIEWISLVDVGDEWSPCGIVHLEELERHTYGSCELTKAKAEALLAKRPKTKQSKAKPQPGADWIDRAAQRIGEGWNANAQMVAAIIRDEFGKQ